MVRPIIIGSAVSLVVLLLIVQLQGLKFDEKVDALHQLDTPMITKSFKTASLFIEKEPKCNIYTEYRICRFMIGFNYSVDMTVNTNKLSLIAVGFKPENLSYYVLGETFKAEDEDGVTHEFGIFNPVEGFKPRANKIYLIEYSTGQWDSGSFKVRLESDDSTFDRVDWE